MFGRKRRKDAKTTHDDQWLQAQMALGKSLSDLADIEKFRPVVEETVRGHRRLQRENHFSQRMTLAYRGDS